MKAPALCLVACVLLASAGYAQDAWFRWRPRMATPDSFDGRFNFCRIMIFMTHNTDISDSWEREGEDPNYFYRFSVDGYAVAVNVLLHAMTR